MHFNVDEDLPEKWQSCSELWGMMLTQSATNSYRVVRTRNCGRSSNAKIVAS